MRSPWQLRLAALLGVTIAVALGVGLSLAVHYLFDRTSPWGFRGMNAVGLLEGFSFILGYSLGLFYIRLAMHLPSPLLLSFGFVAPPSASRVAETVPVIDAAAGLHTLMQNRIVIVEEGGVPVGVTGLERERISSWERLPKVQGGVAVTELRTLLAREPLIIVMQRGRVAGVITQEMYLNGLWGTV